MNLQNPVKRSFQLCMHRSANLFLLLRILIFLTYASFPLHANLRIEGILQNLDCKFLQRCNSFHLLYNTAVPRVWYIYRQDRAVYSKNANFRRRRVPAVGRGLKPCCPTLTKGSKWQITQIWESDIFRLDLAYSTSIPSLEQKDSSCWKIFRSRHNDIALMSM